MKKLLNTTLLILLSKFCISQVTIVPALNGTNLPLDTFTTLDDIIIYENTASDISNIWNDGGEFDLKAPDGYIFQIGSYTTIPSFGGNNLNLFAVFQGYSNGDSSRISIGLEFAGPTNILGDTIIIQGVKVKPISSASPPGNILRITTLHPGTVGDAIINGIIIDSTNFGSLSTGSTSSIESIEKMNPDWEVYPNPFTSYITVKSTNSIEHVKANIYSVNGCLMFEQNLNSEFNEIILNNPKFENGIYFLTLSNEKATRTFKIIKN